MSALDIQHGGDHYKDRAIQPVEFIMGGGYGFCEGNCIKYLTRHREKGGREDLEKARHYLQFIHEDEIYQRNFYSLRERNRRSGSFPAFGADKYIEANGITNPEAGVIRHLAWWNCTGRPADLSAAIKWMDEMLGDEASG